MEVVRGNRNRLGRRAALTLIAAPFVAAAGGPRPAGADPLVTVRVATTPTDIGAEPFYAADRGYFERAGLDAQIQVIANGAAIAAAVASGAIDIAQSNVVSVATAHDRGLPLVIVAPAGVYSSSSPTSALVVAKNSPIVAAKDLNGKILACNGLKNISQLGPLAWIDANGGDAASTKWIDMPFPEMPQALTAGRVAAALIAEPELSSALGTGNVRVLGNAYDAIAHHFMIGAWFTTADWAKAHPDVIRRYQAAMRQAARWANKNPRASALVLEEYTKIVPTPAMKRTTYSETMDPELMQPLIDAAARYGILRAPFPALDLLAPEAR
jgi:NitT/TauT family transport system substrate-binding protein